MNSGDSLLPHGLAAFLSLVVGVLIYWLATDRGGLSSRTARYLGGGLGFLLFLYFEIFLLPAAGGS